jgi:membrane associated rhomboid family serine protease
MFKNLRNSFLFVALMWAVQIINFLLQYRLNAFGINPRHLNGLIGIICSPFLHGSFSHLMSNTIPLFVLLFLLFTFYRRESFGVITIIIVLGGLLLWAIGRPAYHVGASLLIYGLVAYLFLSGILRKKVFPLILSVIIAVVYGGLIFGLLPIYTWMSWEGHISGVIAGLFASIVFISYKDKPDIERY